MGYRPRLPQGEGPGLSSRIVDDAALGSPRARAGTRRRARLPKLAQGTVCKILNEQEIKPHKVRYDLERRDPEFKQKMAEVLCVYREVRLIKETKQKGSSLFQVGELARTSPAMR